MAKKRSSGEGSVWKLKSGSWRGQLMDGYQSQFKRTDLDCRDIKFCLCCHVATPF